VLQLNTDIIPGGLIWNGWVQENRTGLLPEIRLITGSRRVAHPDGIYSILTAELIQTGTILI